MTNLPRPPSDTHKDSICCNPTGKRKSLGYATEEPIITPVRARCLAKLKPPHLLVQYTSGWRGFEGSLPQMRGGNVRYEISAMWHRPGQDRLSGFTYRLLCVPASWHVHRMNSHTAGRAFNLSVSTNTSPSTHLTDGIMEPGVRMSAGTLRFVVQCFEASHRAGARMRYVSSILSTESILALRRCPFVLKFRYHKQNACPFPMYKFAITSVLTPKPTCCRLVAHLGSRRYSSCTPPSRPRAL